MIIIVWTVPAAPGLRAAPSAAREPTRPWPMPANPAARPKPIPAPIAFAAPTENRYRQRQPHPEPMPEGPSKPSAKLAKKTYLNLFILLSPILFLEDLVSCRSRTPLRVLFRLTSGMPLILYSVESRLLLRAGISAIKRCRQKRVGLRPSLSLTKTFLKHVPS